MECKGEKIYLIDELYVVLIETLWNVKRELDVELNSDIGINRNIVECKEISKCGISVYGPPY